MCLFYFGLPLSDTELIIWYKSIVSNHLEEPYKRNGIRIFSQQWNPVSSGIHRVLSMVFITRHKCVYGFCVSSGILNNSKAELLEMDVFPSSVEWMETPAMFAP
jgi:hypothetical protein